MQELYESMIKDLLKKYVYAKDFIDHASDQIGELEAKKEGKLIAKYGPATGSATGGGKDSGDKILNLNAKIDMLKKNLEKNRAIVKEADHAFEGLSQMDIDITVSIYGTKRSWNKIDLLKEKYHYEKSQLYAIAKSSMEHMAYRLYGDA